MKTRVSAYARWALLSATIPLVLMRPATIQAFIQDAHSDEGIQIVSDRFGGDGDSSNNPRVIVVVVPQSRFTRESLPRIARHLLSQYDNAWLELWLYSDRDQLVDAAEVNLFHFFEDENAGARTRRPWGLALRLDEQTKLKFKDGVTMGVVSIEW